jgi:hypothetical protein
LWHFLLYYGIIMMFFGERDETPVWIRFIKDFGDRDGHLVACLGGGGCP